MSEGNHCRETEGRVVVLGGGLTGLSAGYALSAAGRTVAVFEHDSVVGGISKTVERNGFRFDLGPHRFFTKDARIEAFVKDLMGDELIVVPRRTEIFIRGKYFNYPLEPVNAVFGMGIFTTLRILANYGWERIKRLVKKPVPVSLEDWVVANFGRTLFNIYFKEYSEKVWGVDCSRISAEWVARRIRGLSLSKAVMYAFFKLKGRDIPSLVDQFLYPRMGIGRISEKLSREIEQSGSVSLTTSVERIHRSGFTINSIEVKDQNGIRTINGNEFISSIPVTKLISLLDPPAPTGVREAAASLKFRDIVIVTVMVDRPRVTNQTWIYIPEKNIPIGRIHEPTNWSSSMAPEGKTLLVTEFFSFEGDEIWNRSDDGLVSIAINSLVRLGYIRPAEVIESVVTRVPKAYPLFEVGYQKHLDVVYGFLAGFTNLHAAGRGGMFKIG
ncbi:MAG: FAD-dependent oxidoreductase, partial [Nitrospiraceae bacterium]|nr:FAD-dependent oxidoreductase [Nitrospiraceae bacterium]